MNVFSMRSAFALGFGFLAGRLWLHVLLLIGFGLLVPLAVQVLVVGPTASAGGVTPFGAGAGGLAVALLAASYLIQTASYFASWRLGLARDETVGRAAVFAILAALVALVVMALMFAIAGLGTMGLGQRGIEVFVILLVLVPMMLLVAAFYTLFAAVIGAALLLLFVGAIVVGMATGQTGLAATLAGGSGFVVVLLLILSAVLIWLAARLSCVTALMADRRSVNVLAAIRDSWTLTSEGQIAIMRYLGLVGFGCTVAIFALAMLAGFSATTVLGNGAAPPPGLSIALGLLIAIPLPFLVVMVPAGIYRSLVEEPVSADIFA